ncbi:MAG: ABC transporter permease [Acidobacteriota bacterium]
MAAESRPSRRWRWVEQLGQDLGYAGRSFVRTRGFTLAAVFTLALGIGANTGIFSIVYGILLRPLGYEDAERLVLIEAERDVRGTREPVRAYFPLSELDTFRQRPSSFESVTFYATDEGVLSSERGTERVDFAIVSDSFFATLRGAVRLGRPLGPADSAVPSIVISERLWRRAFGGALDVIGRPVVLHSQRGDGSQRAMWRRQPFSIVGVADVTLQFPTPQTDVWTAAEFVRTLNPQCCSFLPLARLNPGVTIGQANADAGGLARGLIASNPRHAGLRARAVGARDQLVRTVRPALLILLAAVGLVLFVACANVMNLVLGRNAARTRELAVRMALGASRGRLAAQAIAESGLLAAAGGAAGIMVAAGIVQILRRLEAAGLPRLDAVRVDGPILLFACASAALATVATGVLPALKSGDLADALKVGGKGVAASRSGRRVRRLLVTLELAFSVVLLVGAILLGRSLVRLIHTDVGVVRDRVVTASLSLTLDRELSGAEQVGLVDRLLARLRAQPGVASAGIGTSLPPDQSRIVLTLRAASAVDYQAAAIPTTPDYFPTLGIPLLRGRLFTDADDASHPAVMIMSADTARHFFGDGDPLGRTLSLPVFRDGATRQGTITLVGVIGDVKYSGLDRAPDDAIYRPFAQQPWPNIFLVARTPGDPAALGPVLRRVVADVDRAIAVSAVNTLDAVVSDAAAQPRFRTMLLAALAGLALALSAVGLYGVVAYSVSQRTMEIGIRMALGARRGDVVRMIVREGLWLAAAGVAIGLVGAYALVRTLTALLYGIAPTDAASFAAAAGALLLFALIASYVPARRASAIDPAIALRAE